MCNEEKGCVTINMKCCGNGGDEAVVPSIGENGNWFIGDQDTGIAASGEVKLSSYPNNAIIKNNDGLYVKDLSNGFAPATSQTDVLYLNNTVTNGTIRSIPLSNSIKNYDEVIVLGQLTTGASVGLANTITINNNIINEISSGDKDHTWDYSMLFFDGSNVERLVFGFSNDGLTLIRTNNDSNRTQITAVYGKKAVSVFCYTHSETIIGQYTDGKPIYQLVLPEVIVTNDDSSIDLSQYDIDRIIDISGTYHNTSNGNSMISGLVMELIVLFPYGTMAMTSC